MATPTDVMNYIRGRFTPTGELQLQKLVYYSQAWHLVWEGKPLFDEPIEAWVGGPVVRSLRHRESQPVATVPQLDVAQRATIDAVIDYYGRHYGAALSKRTHLELPWVEARGDLPANVPSNEPIPQERMRSYYTQQSLEGKGPRRASVSDPANPEEVRRLAARSRERWHDTLALLAK